MLSIRSNGVLENWRIGELNRLVLEGSKIKDKGDLDPL